MADYYLVGLVAVLLAFSSQMIHTGRLPDFIPVRDPELSIDGLRRWRWGDWNVADGLLVVLLVLFSGFRYLIGTDFMLYSGMYRRLNTTDWWVALTTSSQEPGFTILRLLIKSLLGPNPVALFMVTSIIVVIPTMMALKHFASENFGLVIAAYYGLGCYVTTFNGVRQAVASSLVLLAVSLAHRHARRAAVVALLACTIHVSAVLFCSVLLVTWRWRPSAVRLAVTVGLGTAILLVVLPALAPILGAVNPRYARYLATNDGAGIGTYLQLALFIGLVVGAYRIGTTRSFWAGRWFTWSALGIGFLCLGLRVVEFARLQLYFRLFAPLLIAAALSRSRNPGRDTAIVMGLLTVFLTGHLLFYDGLLPYQVWIGYAK